MNEVKYKIFVLLQFALKVSDMDRKLEIKALLFYMTKYNHDVQKRCYAA